MKLNYCAPVPLLRILMNEKREEHSRLDEWMKVAILKGDQKKNERKEERSTGKRHGRSTRKQHGGRS